MKARFHSWWKKIKQHPVITVGISITIVFIVILILGYCLNWDWTGLSSYTPPTKDNGFQRGKTLWDWLQLLFIPIMLAVGGFWLNQLQKNREQKTTEQRDKTERGIAADNQHEIALQGYVDKMSELLLEKNLRQSTRDSEVQKIARVRTLTVLPQLDPDRKRSLLQFLYESGLIDKDNSIVDLKEANLIGAYLVEINLNRANLNGAYLMDARLDNANLIEADLIGTGLMGVDLSRARLDNANLREAEMFGANLSETNLSKANLSKANLSKANLSKANLSKANLSGAMLVINNLSGDGLIEANLNKANLNEANLSGAIVTEKQLEKAESVKDTIKPDGVNPNILGAESA